MESTAPTTPTEVKRVRVYSNLKFDATQSQMMNASTIGTYEATGKVQNVDGADVKVFRVRKPNRNYYVLENEIPEGSTKTEPVVAVKKAPAVVAETVVVETPAAEPEAPAAE